ncbi:spore germination protein GerM [Paenibacillus sp. J31TS4]|uniref:GerMN domain-containing protein n=1 Tax=Paenibacillus sp. J31TS4 TaxID=2807195 RepID=UPI001B04DB27|nr:GerMN domain-containing protein [Paenibacillus sp. J31TS4]GIP39154.1 spore germination protein GerM [Paenibacillus sp. J31TS4]
MAISKSIRWIALTGTIVLMTSGCSLLKSEESAPIDPPPQTAEEMMNGVSSADQTTGSPVSLFVRDAKGYLAPVSVRVPNSDQKIAQRSLEYLVEGGAGQARLPGGFTGVLPKGTQVKSINIEADKKQATVDFSKEFLTYKPQDERKVLEAVTWTLTSFGTVDKVMLRVDGKPLTEMPVAKTPVAEGLTRAMGINVEIAPGVEIGRSTPVTLYFRSESDKFSYYVPVTRMVKRTDQLAQAALEELIKGPEAGKGLASAVPAAAKVLEVKQTEDRSLLTVNFDQQLLNDEKKAAAEAMQAIVLSLTENTGVSKVQLLVNGEAKISSTDDQSYAKPVSRPLHVNTPKM